MPDSSNVRAIALPQHEPVVAGGGRRVDRGALRFALALVAPATIIVALVVGVPMAYALGLSLTDYYLLDPTHVHVIGLQNYATLLGDQVFWTAVLNTLVFTFVAVNLEFLLGLGIAAVIARAEPQAIAHHGAHDVRARAGRLSVQVVLQPERRAGQ